MANICDNEKCAYHIPLPTKDVMAQYVRVNEYDETVWVYRYLYRAESGETIFLCDVCHTAAQMVSKKSP